MKNQLYVKTHQQMALLKEQKEKLQTQNQNMRLENEELNMMLRLTRVQLENNEHMLKMAMDTKLAKARATSMASAVLIEFESTFKTELEGVKALLETIKTEHFALT